MRVRYCILFFLWNLFFVGHGFGGGEDGQAGRENPFTIGGFGARMLSMGNTGVAFPDDPSAHSWNSAGMVVVEQRGVMFSLMPLLEGGQYNYIGYVHPTLSSGTFGFGIGRYGIGGIDRWNNIENVPFHTGEFSYWWGKLSIAYGVCVVKGFSVGINFDANRFMIDDQSVNGFGMDLGLHYQFPQRKGFLHNLFIGWNMINAISRMKLGSDMNTIPYSMRIGVAKKFLFRGENDQWVFLFDYEFHKDRDPRIHFGTEYGWNKMVFLRMGFIDYQFTFGGGIRYRQFQVDYASAQFGDTQYISRHHKFSVIYHIGKSIPEKRRLLEELRQMELQRNINEQVEAARKKRIEEGLMAGKKHLEEEDYFNARLEFSRVLREDPQNPEAQDLLEETTKKDMALQKEREEELLRQARVKEKRIQDNEFINQKLNEGNEALEAGDFQKAIERWQEALERDTNHPLLPSYIEKAKKELNNEINRMVNKAKHLIAQDNLSEAYKVLENAKDQTDGNTRLQAKVQTEIKRLDHTVDFQTNYQAGISHFRDKDYPNAAKFFKKALEYDPDNTRIRDLYRISSARAEGKKTELKGEAKRLFDEGIRLYRVGNYEAALNIWEEALKLEPNSIILLNAIQGAKTKLETLKEQK